MLALLVFAPDGVGFVLPMHRHLLRELNERELLEVRVSCKSFASVSSRKLIQAFKGVEAALLLKMTSTLLRSKQRRLTQTSAE